MLIFRQNLMKCYTQKQREHTVTLCFFHLNVSIKHQPWYRSSRSGSSFCRLWQKEAKARFWCYQSESAIRAISLPSAQERFYSSSAFIKPLRCRVSPRLLYLSSWVSQLSLLRHSTKETALLYFSANLLNLSNGIVCCLTTVYSDSRDPLTKLFQSENVSDLLQYIFKSTKPYPLRKQQNEGRAIS